MGPDSICRIRLPASISVPFFQRSMDLVVQNRPRSDLDGLVRVWPNTSGLEESRCTGILGPGFWKDATGPLPVSHFQTRFRSTTDVQDDIVQNQHGSDLVSGWLCQVLAKRIRSGTKPVCKDHPARFWPMLPSRCGPDANGIRHVYWVNPLHKELIGCSCPSRRETRF